MKYSERVSIQPFVNQVECHIYNQQEALLNFCEANQIKLTAYGPFGGAFGQLGPDGKILLENPKLIQISKEVNRTPAQVCLKFLLQLSPIINVIPKSATQSRILENFQSDFILSDEQVSLLKKENRCFRFYDHFVTYGRDLLSLGH